MSLFSVLVVLLEVHWEAGQGFPSMESLTHTPIADWQSIRGLHSTCCQMISPVLHVLYLVSFTSSSISRNSALGTSAANSLVLSSPELHTPWYPLVQAWATSPLPPLWCILQPELATIHTPCEASINALLHYSLPCLLLGPTTLTNWNGIIWPRIHPADLESLHLTLNTQASLLASMSTCSGM